MPDTVNKTPEQVEADRQAQAVADELVRLRALAQKFSPLEGIAEELDADPSKIYALRAALAGGSPQGNTQQSPAPSSPQLTQEQIDELNRQATEKPAEFMYRAAQLVADQKIAQFLEQAKPVLEAAGDNSVEWFKSKKAGTDKLFKQIEPLFDKQMRDIDRRALLGATPEQRQRALELRWQAASAEVFRAAMVANTPKDPPPNLGDSRGGGGGSSNAKKSSAFERDPELARLASVSGLTADEIADIEKAIAEENE